VAAGYSCLFLAAFYQVIDIWHVRSWALPFVWIGVNPLTIYFLHNVIELPQIANRLVGGPLKASAGSLAEVLVAVMVLALTFAFARFLYRRNIFLRL
jgi:predicted acyltransferase